MNISDRVKSRFVKDFSLPIQIVREGYFDYYLQIYNGLFDTMRKYNLLVEFLQDRTEEQLFQDSNTLVNAVIEDVKNTELYQVLSSYNNIEVTKTIKEREIYTKDNVGKTFISIDLKKANFTSFLLFSQTVNRSIFRGKDTYEQYLQEFTDKNYFIQSKYIRQIIFGNLNPKKQQRFQQQIMYLVASKLKGIFNQDSFTKASSDEIIIETDKPEDKYRVTESLKNNSIYNINMFTLNQLADKPYYVKNFDNGSIEFKCVPAHFFPQCFKYYYKLPITEVDKTFCFENHIATFKESLFE